jgi:ribosomal protein S27AE
MKVTKQQAKINEFYRTAEKKRKRALKKPCPKCGGKLIAFDEWRLRCEKCRKIWYVDKLA